MKDEQIIALFFARSEQAIAELERKHGTAVRRVADNILNDRRDTEECANDTWLAAWNTIPPREPNPLITYVCAIARKLAIKRYHVNTARKRNSRYDAALDELEGAVPALETVETEYDALELAEAISFFLESCSREDRWLFVRRYWCAEGIPDLAASMGWSGHRVSVRLFRLRGRLQDYLEKEGLRG